MTQQFLKPSSKRRAAGGAVKWGCGLHYRCDALERRVLLSVINWNNKGTIANPTDNYDAFGANEAIARIITQRVLDDWERVIIDFNYDSRPNSYDLEISAAFLDDNTLGLTSFNGIEVSSGKYTSADIAMDIDTSWYFDPRPGSSSVPDDGEFVTLVNAYSAAGDSFATDFYAVLAHEVGHAMGLRYAPGNASALNQYMFVTDIDDPNVDGFNPLVNYNFDGGPIDATFTVAGGGHLYEGPDIVGVFSHPSDLMNRSVPANRRRLISEIDAQILRDAYSMTIAMPSQINTLLANLDTDSNDLTLRAEPNVPGTFFQVYRSGGNLVAIVNTTQEIFPIAEIDSIIISADAGGSQFAIDDLPANIPMTINAAEGNDSLFAGDGDYDTNILSNIVFFGGSGTDSIHIDDVSDGVGSDNYILGAGDFRKTNGGVLSFTSFTENLTIDGGTADDTFDITDVGSTLSVTVDGNGGNDTINVGSDIDTQIRGPVYVDGGGGTDSLSLNDGLDAVSGDGYTLTPTSFTKSSMAGVVISFSATTIEDLYLRANAGGNPIVLTGTAAGRTTTIDGAGGDDNIIAADDFDTDFDGYVSIIGNSGEDSLVLDDSGDTGNDNYTLYASLGQLTKSSWAQELDFATIEQVELLASDGNNTISAAAVGFSTAVTIDAGSGDDLIRNGDGANFLDMDNWQGPLHIAGGIGSDSLEVNDSADLQGRSYVVSANSVDRSGSSTGATFEAIDSLTLLAGNQDDEITILSTIHGRVEVNGSEGNDTIHLNASGAVSAMTVFGADGNDTIDAGGGNISSNLISNNITLQGNSGTDRVIFQDTLDTPGADLYTLSQFSLTKISRTIFHNTFESLQLQGSDQPSTYEIDFASIPITVNGGAGNDFMQISSGDLDALSAGAIVNGGGGGNTIIFDDQSDSGADQYNLSSSSLTKGAGNGAFDGVSYSNFAAVELHANELANTITVTSAVTNTRIYANGGADLLQLGTTFASVTLIVDGGSGQDDIRINPDGGIGQAHVSFETSQDLVDLQIFNSGLATLTNGGSKFIRTGALTISGNGALDLTDNAMIIDAPGLPPIQTLLSNGYNGGAWTGAGIRSSAAAAIAANNSAVFKTAIGFGEASALGVLSFVGQGVAGTAICLRYTFLGDANLDRTVDTLDFNALVANFGAPIKRWTGGDFNFDGLANTLDFNELAGQFGQTML